MNLQIFRILATLARLTAQVEAPKQGFLVSDYPPRLPLQGWVYLWTFTLPGQGTFSQLRDAWSKLLAHRVRDCPSLRGIKVFEPSPTERWHAHFVAVERIEVELLRAHLGKYGFGRIHVKRIPASKVSYVAKYIFKSHWLSGSRHAKLVSAVGVKAISKKDVDYSSTWDDYVRKVCPLPPTTSEPWHLRQNRALRVWLESTATK